MSHHIKPLASLTNDEIAALAHAAAARGDEQANPFVPGSRQFLYYELQYVTASCAFA